MDNKNLSKRIILKEINAHLKNSVAGMIIVVILAVLLFAAVKMDNAKKAEHTRYLKEEAVVIQQEEAAKREDEDVFEEINADIKIVCWGDDIADKNGKSSFTYELQRMLDNNGYNAKVVNANVAGDTTKDVMIRCGAVRMLTASEIIIPSSPKLVEISVYAEDGSEFNFLKRGKNQTMVRIGGIWGNLTFNKDKNTYFFERKNAGDKTVVAAGTPVVTKDSVAYKDFLPIISVGMNGGWDDDVYKLIEQQQAILDSCTYNQGSFFMLGFPSYGDKKSEENLKLTEQILLNQWGSHYMNIRRYMSDEGLLNSCEIELGEQDLVQLTVGMVPDAVKRDKVNFTENGTNIIGQLIYYAMEKQGYLPQ